MEAPKRHGGARPNSGGKREGAGRKRSEPGADDPAYAPLHRVVVYLTGKQWAAMIRLGNGSVSSAVRQVIDESDYC